MKTQYLIENIPEDLEWMVRHEIHSVDWEAYVGRMDVWVLVFPPERVGQYMTGRSRLSPSTGKS